MGYSLCRNSVHDRRNRELGERDLRHLSAIAQDNDPIGVTHQLLQFRRDNQQRQAIGAEGFNQANNFRMGADAIIIFDIVLGQLSNFKFYCQIMSMDFIFYRFIYFLYDAIFTV